MENKDSINRFLYLLRFIACLFVITIHAPFPGLFGEITGSLSRFAVPFFFAISGRFLLLEKDGALMQSASDIRRLVSKRLKTLLKTTLVVYLIYLAYSLVWHIYMGIGFSEWLGSKFNLFEARIFLLFNSGKFIYDSSYTFDHMWYLFALIYVYGLIFVFAPVLRKWYKGLIVILLLLLYFGEALQTWYPIRPFDISINTWYVLRNWLLLGMPFVLLGILFGDFANGKRKDRKLVNIGLILTIAGAASSFVERQIFGAKEVYIGSLLMVIGLLFIAEFSEYHGKYWWRMGIKASSLIYFYHVLLIAVLDFLSQNGIIPQYSMGMKPVIVIILCVLIFGVIPLSFKRKEYE